jgi:phosphoribosylformylglycinamidine synthase
MTLKAKVIVTPKKSVLDPQGKAVSGALHSLGYTEVEDVRIGKYMEVIVAGSDAAAAKARLDEMCRRLLANGTIEDYRFEIVADEARGAEAKTAEARTAR